MSCAIVIQASFSGCRSETTEVGGSVVKAHVLGYTALEGIL